jgi:hypothetical protein
VLRAGLGPVALRRAWYHCADCGHGLAPRDDELGVAGTSMSPGLAAMNDLAAAAGPFAGAARLLEKLAGVGSPPGASSGPPRPAAPRSRPPAASAPGSSPPGRWSRSRGAGHVRQLTILGDGAARIWNIATAKFPEATQIVDLYHAREHLHSLTWSLEFMLGDRRDEWLVARLEDLVYGDINGIEAAVRGYPLEGIKKDEAGQELGCFLSNAPACATAGSAHAACSPDPASSRPAARPSSGKDSSRQACTDRRRSRHHHRPALQRGQQPAGSHLQPPSQPDRSRLICPCPKMITLEQAPPSSGEKLAPWAAR